MIQIFIVDVREKFKGHFKDNIPQIAKGYANNIWPKDQIMYILALLNMSHSTNSENVCEMKNIYII